MNELLSGSVRLVLMQFVFSNIKFIPSCLKPKSVKMSEESSTVKGEQCLDAVEDVGITAFISDLRLVNYQLVDAYYQVKNKDGRQYAVARFLFSEKEQTVLSEQFKRIQLSAEQALSQMCEESMWRVRAFLNPFFKEGRIIDDVYALSVNLEARKPLINGNGQPVLQWQRDENGEKVGYCPISLEPKRFLRIINNDIRVIG